MANLYLSDTTSDLANILFGEPIQAANNLVSNADFESALQFAFGDVGTGTISAFSSTATTVSFIVNSQDGSNPTKVEIQGSGFTPNASGLGGIFGTSAFTINQIRAIDGGPSPGNFSSPIATVTINGAVNVAADARLTGFSITGIAVQEGDAKVNLSGTLSVSSLIDNGGNYTFSGGSWTNAKLEVVYDTNPLATVKNLAQVTLDGNFAFTTVSNGGEGAVVLSADSVINGFGFKVFADNAATTTEPVHYLYGTDLSITGAELSAAENMSAVDALRTIFNGSTDTVYASASTEVPEGFENVVIQGGGNLEIRANGLNNVITGNVGDSVIYGGGGSDTFVTEGTLTSALLNADGSIEIKTSTGGTDTLYGVEKIQVGNAAAVDAMGLVSGAKLSVSVDQGTASSLTIAKPPTGDGVVVVGSTALGATGQDGLVLKQGFYAGKIVVVSEDMYSPTDGGGNLKVLNSDGSLFRTFDLGASFRGLCDVVEIGGGRVAVLGTNGGGGNTVALATINLETTTISSVPLVPGVQDAFANNYGPWDGFKLLALPNDAGFYVLGTNYEFGTSQALDVAVVRVTASGDLDANFSGDGKLTVTTNPGSNTYDAFRDASLDSAGNLWIVSNSAPTGVSYEGPDSYPPYTPHLFRVSSNGQTVDRFGALTNFDHSQVLGVQTAVVGGQDKVYVAYTTSDWIYTGIEGGSGGVTVELVRYNSAGALDPSFGDGGRVVINTTGDSSYANSRAQDLIDVDALGNVVLAFNRYFGVEVVKVSSSGVVDVLTDNGIASNPEAYLDLVGGNTFMGSDTPDWVSFDGAGNVLVGASDDVDTTMGGNGRELVVARLLSSSSELDPSFDETSAVSYTLFRLDGSAAPNWVTVDTSGVDPKIKVSAATTAADAGHHYLVLTATGSTTVSKVFDVYIKPLDAGTNDTYVLDTTRVSAGSSIVPLDKDGNASPLGLDTLDLSGANGLVGANSEIIVDAKGGLSGTPEITYWKDGTAAGGQVSYAIDGFERYVLGASTGYFIGRDDLSEYVVIKGGKNYDIVLGSSLTGQVETDIISFEGGQASVEIALSNADDPNTPVVAKVGTGVGAVTHNISGAESVIGSEVADKITGNYADNFLIGNGGDDEIAGGAGDDVLVGGVGAGDKLFGGTGSDQLVDLDGGTLRGNEVQLAANDKANAQKDLFVVNKGATIENFQLSESGTGLAGRSGNANDAIVFNLNLGVIAGLTDVTGWSWVNYNATMTDTQKKAFSAAVRDHVKFDTPVETPVGDVTNVKLELFMYETLNSDGTLSGSKVKVGEVTIADVEKASGDQLVIVGLNKATYPGPQPDVDLNSFPSLFMQTISSETENANIAIALESVKAGTIRQLPGQVVMSAKWDGAAHFYNPAEGNQKIIATNAKDTVELLVQTLADTNGDGKGDAGSDKVYDIGGDDTLSFSNANIDDLHFEAVTVGREVGHQSLKVSYEQTNGTDTNVGDLTWTGHFRSGVDMSLDQVTVADVGGINGQVTYQMADTVYNWDKGVFKGVDLVAQAGEDTIMVGQDNAGKSDHFVIKDGFTVNSTVETTDIYIWGLDSNATTANKTNTLDKIDLSDFGVLDSGDIDLNTANQTMTVSIANSAGTADDRLVIHLMDTNLTTLDDILVYQKIAA